jgi:hypothetical protein
LGERATDDRRKVRATRYVRVAVKGVHGQSREPTAFCVKQGLSIPGGPHVMMATALAKP